MTEHHPLTDEILRDILEAVVKTAEEDSSGWLEDDLMRAAADWQLQQVLDFIAADPMLGGHVKDYIYKAMRPQSDDGYPKDLGDFLIT